MVKNTCNFKESRSRKYSRNIRKTHKQKENILHQKRKKKAIVVLDTHVTIDNNRTNMVKPTCNFKESCSRNYSRPIRKMHNQKEIILQHKRKKKDILVLDTHVTVDRKCTVMKKKSQPDKAKKKEKKFWKTVERMHLKTYQKIVIGIGYDLFRCKIVMMANNRVYLCFEKRYYSSVKDADQYTLKNLKIMMRQGVYLTRLSEIWAFNKSRSNRKYIGM